MPDRPLRQLLIALPAHRATGNLDVRVRRVVADSRQVQPGDLFVAVKGLTVDGHDYIPEAIGRGAVAIVSEKELGGTRWNSSRVPQSSPKASAEASAEAFPGVPIILVPDSRAALATLSAALHDFPSRRLRVVGVTGTDGKTTTCTLIRAVLEAGGHRVGMISTVAAYVGDQELDTGFHVTTPEAPDVQRYLAMMVEAGCDYAVLEATSHGLAQGRVDAVDFDVAVVTNITHEHLDFHGSFEAYRDAKADLFRRLSQTWCKPGVPKVSVLNADDASFDYLAPIPADEHLFYSVVPSSETAEARSWKHVSRFTSYVSRFTFHVSPIIGRDVHHTPAGLSFTAETPAGQLTLISPLIGAYNASNILAAVAVGVSQGVPLSAIQAGVASVRGIVGRMDPVDEGQDFLALVDFAHTPGALERALETARELTRGQVIVVFGCAGLRDREKRPRMGEIAGRLADRIVITAEDPRTERLEDIMVQIAAGCRTVGRREGVDFWRVGDRGEAIQFAVEMAKPGDLVMVCGKGHERSMCFGTTEYPWSDHAALRGALRQRLAMDPLAQVR